MMLRGTVRIMPSLKSRCRSSLVNHLPDDEHEVNDVERSGQEDKLIGTSGQPHERLQREEEVACDVEVVQHLQRFREQSALFWGQSRGIFRVDVRRASERVHSLQGEDDNGQHHEHDVR